MNCQNTDQVEDLQQSATFATAVMNCEASPTPRRQMNKRSQTAVKSLRLLRS